MLLLLKDFCKVAAVHLKQDGLMESPMGLEGQENWPERLHLALDGKMIFKDESERTGLACDFLYMVVPSLAADVRVGASSLRSLPKS